MNVNSTSTYTYGSSASKGMSGLASGLDTESLVKEMLSGTQSKIDKQEGLKQQTEWKQEIYRDLITQINTFQKGYFSSGSATSLTSSALYNTMSATSASKNLTVTASSSAPAGNTSITVHQLAANYSITSAEKVSGRMAGTMNLDQIGELIDAQKTGDRVLALNVGAAEGASESSVVKIDLKSFFVSGNSFREQIDGSAIAAEIQKQLKEQANLDAKVSISGGQLSIVSKDADRSLNVSNESSALALSALGLTTSSAAKLNLGKTQRTLTSTVKLAPALSFNMTLDDGMQKEISLDARALTQDSGGKVTAESLMKTLSAELDQKFGKGVVTVTGSGNGLEFSTAVAGRKLVVNNSGSDKSLLGAMGFKNGQSNRIAAYNTLKEMQVSTPLQGGRFEFEINGAQFSFSEDDDIDYVMNTINSSTAGVTVVYKPLEDTFVMTANDAGAGRTIEMSQTQGNLLNVMFGRGDGSLKTGGTVASAPLTGDKLPGGTTYLEGVRSGIFSLTVNGKDYSLELPKRDSDYTAEEILEKLNAQLRTQFGVAETLAEDGSDIQNIELVKDETGDTYSLAVRNGAAVELAGVNAESDDAEKLKQIVKDRGNLAVALGLVSNKTGQSNLYGEDMKLSDIGWEELATQLGIGADTTLAGLREATQNSTGSDVIISFEDGRFVVSAKEGKSVTGLTLGSREQTQLMFGVDSLSLNAEDANGRKSIVTEGRNAIVSIDGTLTERNSNVFSYNGMTVELNGVSKPAEGGGAVQGKLMVDDGAGGLKEWQSVNGRWVDAQGYERAEDNRYVAIDGAGHAMHVDSADELLPGYTLKRYPSAAFFTADGQKIGGVDINAAGELLDANGEPLQAREAETVTVTRDTEKIVETVKGFIDEYNKLVKTVNDYLTEDANYRDYAPLTDEQRKEMSDKQIELWEEKAKEGLLRRDSILTQFLQDMRTIWYETNSSGYAIYQFGIETGDWATRGQLTFSSDGEATLRKMLASDPNGVMNFFASSVDGAAVRVNEVIRSVANTSSGSPGTLVELAGLKGMASEKNNTLYDQIKKIDEQIERLKDQYEKEKDRYWSQFNAMEQAIANMNSQSSYLAQMFTY